MNSKKLSFSFILYAFFLWAAAAFSYWAQSRPESTAWLFLAGFGIFTWAHFLNRKHYWAFTALLGHLLLMAAAFGWHVIEYFRPPAPDVSGVHISETGFILYSILFAITMVYLLLISRSANRIKQELH